MMDVTNKLPLRLRAVGWAAAVALLPAYASARYVVDTKTAEHIGFLGLTNVPVLTAMAVVAALIPSYFLCWRLLDYEQYHHGPTAAGTGILTCLLAYLLLLPCGLCSRWPIPILIWQPGDNRLVYAAAVSAGGVPGKPHVPGWWVRMGIVLGAALLPAHRLARQNRTSGAA